MSNSFPTTAWNGDPDNNRRAAPDKDPLKIPDGTVSERGKTGFYKFQKGVFDMKTSDPFHSNEAYLLFLKMAGQGCISGNIMEWPQLKPSCKWATEEIERLRAEIKELKS